MTDFKVITGTKKLNALSLFVPILLVFLVLRVAVIILSGYEFGEVLIIRAVISDICIAAVVALLISLVPIRILQFVLGSLVCILGSANVEHILANGANMDVAFSKYLADTTFLSGSVLTANRALFTTGLLILRRSRQAVACARHWRN